MRRRPPVPILAVVLALVPLGGCDGDDRGARDGRPPPAPTAAAGGREPAPAPAIPEARTEVAGGVLDGRILVAGGLRADGSTTDRVDVYDPASSTWSPGPALPLALHHHGVATVGERLFVAGGFTPGPGGAWVEVGRVWSLGAGEGAWQEEPALAAPRGALGLAAAAGRLVAFGGVSGGQVVATTEILDPGGGSWRPGPDLAGRREHTAAASAGGRVYAVAGRVGSLESNLASVESLDPAGGRWRREPDLAHSRGGTAAAGVAGAGPCVAGGEEPGGTIASVECLRDGRWRTVASLATARHGLAVVGLAGNLHVIAGGDQPGLFVTDVHEVVPVGP